MKSIKVANLTKKYGEKLALDDVSFQLKSGEVFGIVGPNASGKTTLMSIISGLTQIFDGEVLIDGVDIKEKNRQKRKIIGCLIEEPGLYPNLTGYQNLKYFSSLLGKDQENNISYLIEALMLKECVHKKVKKYSLGMKQRLGLAISALGEPDFLILDEPTNGLDPEIVPKIRAVINEYAKKNIGIMISSHNLSEIESICSSVLILKQGRVIDEFDINRAINQDKESNFILSSDNIREIKQYLLKKSYLVSELNNDLIVMLSNSNTSSLINELIGEGFKINSIAKYKQSLENRFLKAMEEEKNEMDII